MRGSLDSGHPMYCDPLLPFPHSPYDLSHHQIPHIQSQILHHNPQLLPFPIPSSLLPTPLSTHIKNSQVLPQNQPQEIAMAGPGFSAFHQGFSGAPQYMMGNTEAGRARSPLVDASVALQQKQKQGGMGMETQIHHNQKQQKKNCDVVAGIIGEEEGMEKQGVVPSQQCEDMLDSYTTNSPAPARTEAAAAATEQSWQWHQGTTAITQYYGGDSIISNGKHLIKSPSWLPHGWVTEVQIRQTGSTAGTRDKYYKDLLTGRRFRSRNEVMHFLETGKGRVRRRDKGDKLIAYMDSVSGSYAGHSTSIVNYQLNNELNQMGELENGHATAGFLMNPFPNLHQVRHTVDDFHPHQVNRTVHDFPPSAAPQGEFFTPTHHERFSEQQSLSPETDEFDSHSGFIGFSLPPVPATPEFLSSAHLLLPGRGSHHPASSMSGIGLKRNAPETQTLHKKSKTSSRSNNIDLKHASRLYQWLQKSDPKRDEPSEMINISSESSAEQLSEEQERDAVEEDLESGIEAAQRTVELGKDVQTAQRTVIQLGKEMKTLVEKLGHNVQVVQRAITMKKPDDTTDNNLPVDFGKQTIERANDAICNAIQAAQTIDVALASLVQAAERIDGAMGNIIQASQNLEVSMNNVIQATHDVINSTADSTLQVTRNEIQTASLADSTRKALNPPIENEINSIQPANVASGPSVQRTSQPGFAMNNASMEAMQEDATANLSRTSQILDDDLTEQETQAYMLPNYKAVTQAALISVVTVADVVAIQPAQMPQRFTTPSVIQPIQMSVSADGKHDGILGMDTFTALARPPTTVVQPSQYSVAAIKHLEDKITSNDDGVIFDLRDTTPQNLKDSKQIAYVKPRKFSLWSPKFDLSRIHPNMTSRQRAKMVQKMKMMHGRGLLAALGRELCHIALGRKARLKVLGFKPYTANPSRQAWVNNTNNQSIIKNGKQDENEEDLWSKDETRPEFNHHISEIEDDTSSDDASEEVQ